jgi:hypothetical protein
MDFIKLKELKAERIVVLDTSAILENYDWDNYKAILKLEASKNIYVLTTCVLSEIDNKAHDNKTRIQDTVSNFIAKLRNVKTKLSDGYLLENGDILFYLTNNLTNISDPKLDYADQKSTDFKLIELAKKLKEDGFNASISARDGLIQILCLEFDIDYIFFPSIPNPTITGTGIPPLSITVTN